jgi:exodeoxyribonuclease VII small subunit
MKEIAELSFEEAFGELEATVARLERGDLSLEESIALFERGQALAAHCNLQLDTAELKVRQLLPDNEGETAPFELE